VRTPTFSVEVITLPVSDIERALRFYVDQVGFTLDVDYWPNDAFPVVQLTPPGSSCSIQISVLSSRIPVANLRQRH
jgi:catechol 2,3-dioxygenase-like lactoylglutathione lyase family enzyme